MQGNFEASLSWLMHKVCLTSWYCKYTSQYHSVSTILISSMLCASFCSSIRNACALFFMSGSSIAILLLSYLLRFRKTPGSWIWPKEQHESVRQCHSSSPRNLRPQCRPWFVPHNRGVSDLRLLVSKTPTDRWNIPQTLNYLFVKENPFIFALFGVPKRYVSKDLEPKLSKRWLDWWPVDLLVVPFEKKFGCAQYESSRVPGMIFWPLRPGTRLDSGIGGFLRYQTWEQTGQIRRCWNGIPKVLRYCWIERNKMLIIINLCHINHHDYFKVWSHIATHLIWGAFSNTSGLGDLVFKVKLPILSISTYDYSWLFFIILGNSWSLLTSAIKHGYAVEFSTKYDMRMQHVNLFAKKDWDSPWLS